MFVADGNNSSSYNNGFGCLHDLLCRCNSQCDHNLSFGFTCCYWWLLGSLLSLLDCYLHRSLIRCCFRHLYRCGFSCFLRLDCFRFIITLLWFCFASFSFKFLFLMYWLNAMIWYGSGWIGFFYAVWLGARGSLRLVKQVMGLAISGNGLNIDSSSWEVSTEFVDKPQVLV